MHSPNFEKVKRYYEAGYWSQTAVRKAVERGWITEKEYAEIVEEEDVH